MKRKNKTLLTSSAEVVDNHLILSLTNANEPIVWRMALDKIGTASFEIKEVKTNGYHKLVLKPKKGTAETIATFMLKDDALAALIQASDAMQSPTNSNSKNVKSNEQKINIITPEAISPLKKQGKGKWILLLLGLLIVIGLYSYLTSLMPNRVQNFGSTTTSSAPAATPNSQSGIPMSADDFLNNM